MEYNTHRCIIKQSLEIRTALNKRIDDFNMSSKVIVQIAKDQGVFFTEPQLARYRKHGDIKGAIRTSSVVWLCKKFNIELGIKVKKRRMSKGEVDWQ